MKALGIGAETCACSITMFHSFTGCDAVSFFGGMCVWPMTVTAAFCTLGATADTESIDDCLPTLEQFVVLLYNRTSNEEISQARKQLSTQKGRTFKALAPIQAALIEHTKRVGPAAYMYTAVHYILGLGECSVPFFFLEQTEDGQGRLKVQMKVGTCAGHSSRGH